MPLIENKILAMYTRDIEIRKLNSVHSLKLAQMLNHNDSWKKLMHIIPKNAFSNSPDDMKKLKYGLDDERLIEDNASINRMAAEILLDEWGTSGRQRPTLGVLLDLLVRAELFRAADHIAVEYLNEPIPPRPSKGPAAKIDISIPFDSNFSQNFQDMLQNGDFPGTETLNDNVNLSRLADNNIDYYEKYTPNYKLFAIPQKINESDKLSSSSLDNSETESAHLYRSDLIAFSSNSVTVSQDAIPMLSALLPSSSVSSESNNSSSTVVEQPSIHLQSFQEEIIPDLSALNIHDNDHKDIGDKSQSRPPDELLSSMISSSSASTISSSPDDVDNDISAPNLSILDQRSSNNDSSLTNVTATSEDNSFEMSLNEASTSYDNIPCLSILKESYD